MRCIGLLGLFVLLGGAMSAQTKEKEHPHTPKSGNHKVIPPANEKQENAFLDMQGLIYVGKSRGKAYIKVLEDTSVFLKTESDKHFGKTHFPLPFDRVFIVEISKEGFVSKKIKVDTHLPSLKRRRNMEFRFEADILEDIPGLNVEVLKKPVAEIRYNSTFDSFIYDVEYTSKVKKELKKLYENYYLLQKDTVKGIDTITPVVPEK
jgi:hypothetical protein